MTPGRVPEAPVQGPDIHRGPLGDGRPEGPHSIECHPSGRQLGVLQDQPDGDTSTRRVDEGVPNRRDLVKPRSLRRSGSALRR